MQPDEISLSAVS